MPVIYSYRVRKVADKRMAASLVSGFAEDCTSLEELEKLKVKDTFFIKRERGTGRPTKKERRDIDRLTGDILD
jgi:ribosome-associated heat shock protein Hsp15